MGAEGAVGASGALGSDSAIFLLILIASNPDSVGSSFLGRGGRREEPWELPGALGPDPAIFSLNLNSGGPFLNPIRPDLHF